MTSIKLEEKQIVIGERIYTLHVNMSVLDRVQTAVGGEINVLLNKSVNDSMAITMAAMLNDWAEDQGWDEDWTEKKVKKIFTTGMMNELDVTGMFFRAMSPNQKATPRDTENNGPGEEPGN